jgi:glycine cleavage system protein P-like pyridoxal-binding family
MSGARRDKQAGLLATSRSSSTQLAGCQAWTCHYGLPVPEVPAALARKEPPRLPELAENEIVRHFTNLADRNFGIDTGFYPLGSCTMKYNPRVNELAARMPGFAHLHPHQEDEGAQGARADVGAAADSWPRAGLP